MDEEIPDKYKGNLDGGFFRRNEPTYTFIAFKKEDYKKEKKNCEKKIGYKFLKKVEGINSLFVRVANSFVKKFNHIEIKIGDICLEDIIKYAKKKNERNH